MAEIQFERRGTPLWLVVLVLLVLGAAAFGAYRLFGPGSGPTPAAQPEAPATGTTVGPAGGATLPAADSSAAGGGAGATAPPGGSGASGGAASAPTAGATGGTSTAPAAPPAR